LDEPVLPGALADVTVKLGAVKLLHKVFDLCDELDKKKEDVEIQCPIKDGDLTVSSSVNNSRFFINLHIVIIGYAKSDAA
jgi:hypothetical protein